MNAIDLCKSARMDLFKAGAKGAGSRGGKIIGYTQSGKPIYENANHFGHKNFTARDHSNAVSAHLDKQWKLQDKDGVITDSDKWSYHVKQITEHSKLSDQKRIRGNGK